MDTTWSAACWIGSLKSEDTRDIKIWPRTPLIFYFGKNVSRLERIFSLDDRKAYIGRRRTQRGGALHVVFMEAKSGEMGFTG